MDGNEKLYNFKERSFQAALVCLDPSKTVQADMEDADINVIVHRYGITGQMPQSVVLPEYRDYEEVFDYHTAQLAIAEADRAFMELPAHIRAEFDNDPGVFFNIASDPENIDYLRDLGLAKPKVIVDDVVPVIPPVVVED